MAGKTRKPASNHGNRGVDKAPRSSFDRGNERRVRGAVPNYSGAHPLWAFARVDRGGSWCWDRLDGATLMWVLGKLGNFETMTWAEIEAAGSHLVRNDAGLSKLARDRLAEIEHDEADTLFSLRLGGQPRIWGIRVGGALKIMWWDPNHEVYPAPKKHT
jgi:hypothetical protein